MKRRIESRRRGVVLLLILGLMAMFALSVLSYMIVTSNMAETARNMQKKVAAPNLPVQNDLDFALNNVLIGSNNENNPIGPFSILENMYGDWRLFSNEYETINNAQYIRGLENTTVEFTARIGVFPDCGVVALTPYTDFDGNPLFEASYNDSDRRRFFSDLFESSGNVVTLKSLLAYDADSGLPDNLETLWNNSARSSSAYVLEKVITNPVNSDAFGNDGDYWANHYNVYYDENGLQNSTDVTSNQAAYKDFDYWHLKVELNDDVKRFVQLLGNNRNAIVNFNRSNPTVVVRMNRPAYSGTGAGGLSPGDRHDSMQIPFAFWGNAAAPDFAPFWRIGTSYRSFRSYWAHLTDAAYESSNASYAQFNNDGNTVASSGAAPVRLNPSYTAPDSRTLFLAHYDLNNDGSLDLFPSYNHQITPSFFRPTLFKTLLEAKDGLPFGSRNYLEMYAGGYNQAQMFGLFRRLTPRPLPSDHWNFSGGNPYLDYWNSYYAYLDGSGNEQTVSLNSSYNALAGLLSGYYLDGAYNFVNSHNPYDVDNDNDGVRDGIWIPSGLPIRYDKNGTPYATMFSYTIVDLDGRVNVNTAGNWDQLPNRFYHEGGNFVARPYYFVDELDDLWNVIVAGNVSLSTPFYVADNLKDAYDWLDDNNSATELATRGEGRGVAETLLYEALADIFDSYNEDLVVTTASNLLWRRNLRADEAARADVNTSNLKWFQNGIELTTNSSFGSGILAPQPGYAVFNHADGPVNAYNNSSEVDDALGTREKFFRFMDPIVMNQDIDGNNIATKYLFPWRGKTTVDMATNLDLFDYADTAFRTYDPLGAQVYTYSPRYSRNPYLAPQTKYSPNDAPYSLPMLERLLRPHDTDSPFLPSQLVDDLGLYREDLPAEINSVNRINERRKARNSLTTISSDVPNASMVFPDNFKPSVPDANGNNSDDDLRYGLDVAGQFGNVRSGSYGFVQLIRNNVEKELRRVFEVKDLCLNPNLQSGGSVVVDASGNAVPDKSYNSYIDDNDAARALFYNKVDEITMQLAAMLPKEILVGEKIDLNALAQKNYWLDVDYNSNGNLAIDNTLHNEGLVRRMEFARGLYLVMMTLLYDDMNAQTVYDPNELLSEDGSGNPTPDLKLSNYIEGSFDLLKYKGDEDAQDLMARELMATRIAQWCVNAVDFADPDATMTPFFFDPTPFDGWWMTDYAWIDGDGATYVDADGNELNRWKQGAWTTTEANAVYPYNGAPNAKTNFLFEPVNGDPSQQMREFFLDALDNSVNANPPISCYRNFNGAQGVSPYLVKDPTTGAFVPAPAKPSNKLIAEWTSHKIDDIKDQATDLGFRMVWGMERPDLVLTETLNFHDLGIADSDKEKDPKDGASAATDGGDQTYDQVRRPQGSSYLELYCTTNPNVPQSPELYDYESGSWQLRLSKLAPVYTIDAGKGHTLEMPIWRVAIGASSDPKNLFKDPETINDPTEKQKAKDKLASKEAVYQNANNGVLNRLTPKKSKDDYLNDFSFFSMQPRQFRNLPMPFDYNSAAPYVPAIDALGDLDLDQGWDSATDSVKEPNASYYVDDWKDFNLYSSNLLGPAIAASDGDEKARLREVELDRILIFAPVGSAVANPAHTNEPYFGFPDAYRMFGRETSTGSGNLYLKPNEYLVVGPAEKRNVGSASYLSTSDDTNNRRFGQNIDESNYPDSYIDLTKLNLHGVGNYKYMVARSNIGTTNQTTGVTTKRGFNISEPLWWNENIDPYYANQANKITPATDPSDPTYGAYDVPFEMPKELGDREQFDNNNNYHVSNFYDKRVANFPIVQDELFGQGVVPAYKSAFLQRVADPNRPYHPLMNPYITVDWNVMDLTVFTGENATAITTTEIDKDNEDRPFSMDAKYTTNYPKNQIKIARNLAFGLTEEGAIAFDKAFSSRKWGTRSQKTFAPWFKNNDRPNPWARAFKFEDGNKDDAGLERPNKKEVISATTTSKSPAFAHIPSHNFGMLNSRGKWGYWTTDAEGKPLFVEDSTSGNTFEGLNPNYLTDAVYGGAPAKPFEHLAWNDAPFSNPYEIMDVPASSPGRFGLEFVHENSSEGIDLGKLYKVDADKKGALGSYGVYGYSDWYHNDNIKLKESGGSYQEDDELKKLKDKDVGFIGPYLNFLASSKKPGETLNFNRLLEFVRVPSLNLGTKELAGVNMDGNVIADEFANPTFYSKRQEPGKINLNTTSKPAWNAISLNEDGAYASEWPGTPWSDFLDSRRPTYSIQTGVDASGEPTYVTSTEGLTYFQPSHTLNLWVQMDQCPPPVPVYSTLLAQSTCDVSDMSTDSEDSAFNNRRTFKDVDGEVVWQYEYDDPSSGEKQTGETSDQDQIDNMAENETNYPNFRYWIKKSAARGNLHDALAEMQRLSGLTTNRSNVFAVWMTVGYFEVERCRPGDNMPNTDPDGNTFTLANMIDPNWKWYNYYQAIYPDGFTYSKELGLEYGETQRHRGFAIIDRSIPVDFRRGASVNASKAILMKRRLD